MTFVFALGYWQFHERGEEVAFAFDRSDAFLYCDMIDPNSTMIIKIYEPFYWSLELQKEQLDLFFSLDPKNQSRLSARRFRCPTLVLSHILCHRNHSQSVSPSNRSEQ